MTPTNVEVAERFLLGHPDISTRGAARRLMSDYPKRFWSENSARGAVKKARGSHGKYQLKYHPPRVPPTPFDDRNPFGLPDAVKVIYEDFHIPGNRILVFSDIHIPYHSLSALTVAMEYGSTFKPDTIFINGDFFDFPKAGPFVKEPEARNLKSDLEDGYKLLESFKTAFPGTRIIFKYGNHDEWFNIYARKNAPELADLPAVWLENQFWLKRKTIADLGIEIVKDGRKCFAGKLPILHGHEIGMKTVNVNPARTAFLKCGDSVLVGHLHKSSQHTETDMHGKLVTSWSTGCLCQLHPRYARINKWNHGFATVEVGTLGSFKVESKRIYKGDVW